VAGGRVERLDDVVVGPLEQAFRREWPRMLATLIKYTGSIELAEDSLQEALLRASTARDRALLINPAAWITTVAKRIAIDTVRRDATLRRKLPLLATDPPPTPPDESPGGDDRLGLLFVACNPALTSETRLALALRFVCGVPTTEIAAAMLASPSAMGARLSRAKRQIEREGIRFSPPDELDGGSRVEDVLATVHLLYTVGHTAFEGEQVGSRSVATTAIELARALHTLRPDDREASGLLALLLLTDARASTRTGPDGAIVTLEHAQRRLWDRDLIEEGMQLAAQALRGGGRFALEAGISGLHSSAREWKSTDWPAICLLYDRLVESWPSPPVILARLVARSFVDLGPRAALVELDELEPSLTGSTARQAMAVRADLLRRLGRIDEARDTYLKARSHERNGPVRDYFGRRVDELGG
jgi:RNA polymerase sigma-70 factor (ECF subfamily)